MTPTDVLIPPRDSRWPIYEATVREHGIDPAGVAGGAR